MASSPRWISLIIVAHGVMANDAAIWTCEEITYNLCQELEMDRAQITVRGMRVTAFRYHANTTEAQVGAGLPIIAIHGGPGFDHQHITPLNQLACRGHDVIFYDQAGTGESERPNGTAAESAPWLLTIDYYLEELQAVIDHYGLTKFHLFGQSWGTVVGQLYAIRHPEQDHPLSSLILSGPLSDTRLYMRGQSECDVPRLPPFLQDRLRKFIAEDKYDSAEFNAIDATLTTHWTMRITPKPDCIAASFASANMEIYVKLQGPSEFVAGGVLKDWNITSQLGGIRVPTLVSHGLYDTMVQPTVETIHRAIPGSRLVVFQHSGHLTVVDDNERFNNEVHAHILMAEGRTVGEQDVPRAGLEPLPAKCTAPQPELSPLTLWQLRQQSLPNAAVTLDSVAKIATVLAVAFFSFVVGRVTASAPRGDRPLYRTVTEDC